MEDAWEDTVATYCLGLGVQFGLQIFASSRKAPSGPRDAPKPLWHPSTIFLASHTLTAALRDVASRCRLSAAPGTPASCAGLACAVRDLHNIIFQPYNVWLEAARLRPASRPNHAQPSLESLHLEMSDLALYWLVYSEAANLRHTPEMLWFIFFCAQRSWQAKQVLSHIRLHQAALSDLLKQPWVAALGPSLLRAVQVLHDRYRRALAGDDGGLGGGADDGGGIGLMQEATFRVASDMKSIGGGGGGGGGDGDPNGNWEPAARTEMPPMSGSADITEGAVQSHDALRITVIADGSVSVPHSSHGKDLGSEGYRLQSSPAAAVFVDDAGGEMDRDPGLRDGAVSELMPTAAADVSGRRRHCTVPDSPCLPLPPSIGTFTNSSKMAGSAFAAPGAAAVTAASLEMASAAPPPNRSHQRPYTGIMSCGSTPTSPTWDPRVAVAGYKELLLRFCPSDTAVDAVLAADGGAAGVASDSGKPSADGGSACTGGGTQFLTRVVQPLFLFLTEQVYELGQARRQGLEAAVRIGYDDVSESMAHPGVVAAALAALPWATTTAATVVTVAAATAANGANGLHAQVLSQAPGRQPSQHPMQQPQQRQPQHMMPRAASHDEELYWSRLLAISDLPSSSSSTRIPWQGDMAHYRQQLMRLLHSPTSNTGGAGGTATLGAAAAGRTPSPRQRLGPGEQARVSSSSGTGDDEEAINPTVEQLTQAAAVAATQPLSAETTSELGCLRRANVAADWWAQHVLRKTFAEHRSLAMPVLAFARVYQFQLVWFYVLCAWSWAGKDNMMNWIASAAAMHWGTNCLLWSMQAVLSMGPCMKRGNMEIPAYNTRHGRPRRGTGPAAPYRLYGLRYNIAHMYLLGLAWTALGVWLYIAYIVWPHHDFYGHQCYPLLWGKSCYWWISVLYGGVLIAYEVLYRQLNLGGYVRRHLYDVFLRLVPSQGTAAASSPYNPLYDPAKHLRTGLSYLFGNAVLWGATLALKFVIDYFIIVRPVGPQLQEIMATNKLAWSFDIEWSWWPEGWSRHFTVDLDPCMAAAQVIVLFLLSLVSTGVSYTVATALWGAMQGVVQGIGSIRHWRHIRAGFHRIQEAMRAKLLTADEVCAPDTRPWALRAIAWLGHAILAVLVLPYTCAAGAVRWLCGRPVPSDDRPRSWVERETTLLLTAPFWNAVVRSMRGRDLLSDREAAALAFTAVSFSPSSMLATWRRTGTTGSGTDTMGRRSGATGTDGWTFRETYLPPVAVYVAQIPQLVITGSTPSSEQLEVLQEAYLYLLHLLVAVGAVPRAPVHAAAAAAGGQEQATDSPDGPAAAAAAACATCPDLHKDSFHPDKFAGMPPRAWSHRRLVARRELLGSVVALVRALVDAGKVYKDTESQPSSAAAVASRSRAVDKLSMALHAVARCMSQMRDLPWGMSLIMNRVVARQYYHQPPVKAQLHRGFSQLVDVRRNNATAWGAEHMPSYDDFAKVSSWLLAILRPTDEGTAPSNQEAVSLLADFCSGLMHPRLPTAPRVESMRAVSTLIPHYQETVLYALSSADARRVLEGAGAPNLEGKLPDDEVLFKNDAGSPSELLQYLVSEFPEEFRNLLERCRTLIPLAKDDPPYALEDFLPYGRLYDHRAQLLLWASCRGQVLARTVDGMCMYRTALALQAVHDALTDGGSAVGAGSRSHRLPKSPLKPQSETGSKQEGRLKLSGVQKMMVQGILKDESLCVEELVAQLVDVVPGLGPLLDRKYSLVVSSQVFSKMAGSKTLPDRWRAHGIALLATRYSCMRVAYLEQDGDPVTLFKAPDFAYRVVHQASVLVRAVPLEQEVEARRTARAAKRAAAAAASKAAQDAKVFGADFPSPKSASSPATTAMYGTGHESAGGVVTSPDTATPSGKQPPLVTPPGSWADALSAVGDEGDDSEDSGGDSEDGNDGDDDGGEDRGAMLRLWKRRFLLKHLKAAELEVLFRLQLPVNYYDRNAAGVGVILGEGKPENQNSAVPYCPGVLLQTIDMNQDNSLAQAFKLRNATREFEPLGPGRKSHQVAVVGYPEWIFSYRCGLLADLAAATERTFGTQIQRVMSFPSAVRAHYGHPDLWNRLFTMTRGGVSKANAVQHVSEDVFGGYNALKRGGLSKYVSYISVGKGRDMGLDSILGFEGKISKGCAEQLMSRDLRFLGCNTDFFRSMSLYFTVPGHFINTWLTVVTIQLGIWVQLLLLLGGVGKTGSSVSSAIGAVQILQLGTMPLLGFLFNMWLESGMAVAIATLTRQFIAGGLLFHIVRSVTSAFHLGRAVLFGGASYVATGRGFSLRRRTFTQVYSNYGRSHLYLGADILLMVILILVVGNNGGNTMPIPAAAMWSPILVAVALLAGPFWFTPFFFRLQPVLRDTREFRSWVAGSSARGVAESWPEWNASQLSALRDDAGAQVSRYRFWSTLAIVVSRAAICILSAITAVTGARFDTPFMPDLAWVLGGSAAVWLLMGALAASRKSYLTSGLDVRWRWAKGLVQVVAMAAFVTLAAVCLFMNKKGLRFSGLLITLYANYSVASLVVTVLVVWMPKGMLARSLANTAYRHTDAVLGTALAAVLIVICFIGEIGLIMVDKVQTLVQFNDRYIHSQAARPYAAEDDVTGGGGGHGGGGGAGGLSAAGLQRRGTPMLGGAPQTPRGIGASGGGGWRSTAGGAGVTLMGGSRPPSTVHGWVSPHFRSDGGATPSLSFTNGRSHSYLATGAADAVPPVACGVDSSPFTIQAAGPASRTGPMCPSQEMTPVRPSQASLARSGQRNGVGAAPLSLVSTPLTQVGASSFRASSGGGALAAATSPGQSSRVTSWGSSCNPSAAPRHNGTETPPLSGGADGSSGGGRRGAVLAAVTSNTSACSPQLSRAASTAAAAMAMPQSVSPQGSSASVVVTGRISRYARNRLPPAEDWRDVAEAVAATAASRSAAEQAPQRSPPAAYSLPQSAQQMQSAQPLHKQQQQLQGHAALPWPATAIPPSPARTATPTAVTAPAAAAAPTVTAGVATPASPGRWAVAPAAAPSGLRGRAPSPRRPSPLSQRPGAATPPSPSPSSLASAAAGTTARSRTPQRQLSMGVTGTPKTAVGTAPGRVSDSGHGGIILNSAVKSAASRGGSGSGDGGGGGGSRESNSRAGPAAFLAPPPGAPTAAVSPGSYASMAAAVSASSASVLELQDGAQPASNSPWAPLTRGLSSKGQ